MLDDLYWVMSYSRWKDDRFFPLFRDAILRTHRDVATESLAQAREYNFKRYHFQGIGRYEPDAAYARGLAELRVLGHLIPASGFLFGAQPSSIDAAIYGFIANIHFYEIETPLRDCVRMRNRTSSGIARRSTPRCKGEARLRRAGPVSCIDPTADCPGSASLNRAYGRTGQGAARERVTTPQPRLPQLAARPA